MTKGHISPRLREALADGSLGKRGKAVKIPRPLAAAEHGLFFKLLQREAVPLPVTEFAFHPSRKWRMDFAWPAERVFLEVDGSVWTNGRHTRGSGWLKDTEKLNEAACLGWRALRCTPQQLNTMEMIATVRRALASSKAGSAPKTS